jgi:hypothetical protein
VHEEGDVAGPLPHKLRVLDRTRHGSENADRLVANLEAVAVGAMENIPRPTVLQPRDLRQLIPKAGCDKQPSGGNREATVKSDPKPSGEALDPGDGSVNDLAAIASHLFPAELNKLARREAIAGQKAVHLGCRRVPRHPAVNNKNAAASARQHQRRRQTSRSATHNNNIEISHAARLPAKLRLDKKRCCFRDEPRSPAALWDDG